MYTLLKLSEVFMSKKLYRSFVHDNCLGDPYLVDVFGCVLDAVKRDNNLSTGKDILIAQIDSNILEMLANDYLEFVALYKPVDSKLPDVVYFYIKENKE